MAATVDKLRTYLRLPEEADGELAAYLEAAIAYCSNAGVPPRAADPLYDLLILKLAAQEYDNRGLGFAGSDNRTSEETRQRMLNSFMLNLRYVADEQEAP